VISFLSVFPPFRGGIADFSHYLYKELEKISTIRAYNYKNLYPDLLFPGKTQFAEENNADYAIPLLHSYNPLNWRHSTRILSKDNPDLFIYSHWHPFFAPSNSYILNHLKKLNPDIKIAGILHNVIPHENFPFQRTFLTSLFRKTDYPIVLSEKTLNEFRALNLPPAPHKLFHPVYDQPAPDKPRSALRTELNISDDETVVLFFGLVRKYKGLDILIDALNGLDLEELKIRPLIVGEFYVNQNELLGRIKADHKNRYIIIDRFITKHEVAKYLSISDVMVLPYRSASQSGILSNAINFKLPVIISNLPGLMEHVEENKTGLTFEKENVEDLRDKIKRFQSDNLAPQFRPNLEYLRNKLTWKIFKDRLLDITEYQIP